MASGSGQFKHNIPFPTRAPPPPPDLTVPARSNSVPNDTLHESADSQRSIFRPLENYVLSCFSGSNCLNASFLTSSRPAPIRAVSESAAIEKAVGSRPEALSHPSEPFPELDAKTLLLGDFAENGTWWTGKGIAGRQQPHRNDPKAQEEDVSDRVNSKSPCINWRELNEWYSAVFSVGKYISP